MIHKGRILNGVDFQARLEKRQLNKVLAMYRGIPGPACH